MVSTKSSLSVLMVKNWRIYLKVLLFHTMIILVYKCWRTSLVQERKDKSYIIANDRGLLISRNWVDPRPTNTDYIVHHNHDISHHTNDSAVNTKVVVQNPPSTIPSNANTRCNGSNKSAQKLKPSTGSQRVNQPIVTHSGHTVKPPNKLNL